MSDAAAAEAAGQATRDRMAAEYAARAAEQPTPGADPVPNRATTAAQASTAAIAAGEATRARMAEEYANRPDPLNAPTDHASFVTALKAWARAEITHAMAGRSEQTRRTINP